MISFWILIVLFWIAVCYVAISFIEYYMHGVFMHQPNWFSRKSAYFKEILDEHRSFHHAECFPAQHFDEAEGDCLELNIRLRLLYGQMMSSFIWGSMALLGFWLGIGSTAGRVMIAGSIIFMLSLLAHHQTWNLIHIQMHTKREQRASWFQNSRLCLWLARYHYVHHAHPKVNFCIVCPLADWIMGSFKQPSDRDVADLEKHGFYPSVK